MSKRKKQATPKRTRWQPLERGAPADPAKYLPHGLTVPDAVYLNDRYSVFVREIGHGALHISLHRHDRQAVRDWRHLQQIKNEVAGEERVAVEVFPPESMLADSANEYHLWVLPVGTDLPFCLDGGRVVMTNEQIREKLGNTKARQRPWEPGLTTGGGGAG